MFRRAYRRQMLRRIFDHALQAALRSWEASACPARMARGSSIWRTKANRRLALPTYRPAKSRRASHRRWALVVEETMSADEMIACLGSCRARWEIAAMIKALSLHPWLNTPAETKRLEAACAWRTGSPTATPAKPGATRTACTSATAEQRAAASPHRRANGQRPSESVRTAFGARSDAADPETPAAGRVGGPSGGTLRRRSRRLQYRLRLARGAGGLPLARFPPPRRPGRVLNFARRDLGIKTARAFMSAGRRSPFGPLGIVIHLFQLRLYV